VLRVFPA